MADLERTEAEAQRRVEVAARAVDDANRRAVELELACKSLGDENDALRADLERFRANDYVSGQVAGDDGVTRSFVRVVSWHFMSFPRSSSSFHGIPSLELTLTSLKHTRGCYVCAVGSVGGGESERREETDE